MAEILVFTFGFKIMPTLSVTEISRLERSFSVSFSPSDPFDHAGSAGLIDVRQAQNLFRTHSHENINGLYTTYELPDGEPYSILFQDQVVIYAPAGRPLKRGRNTTDSKILFTNDGFELVTVGTSWNKIKPLIINSNSRYVSFEATSNFNKTSLFIDSAEMGL